MIQECGQSRLSYHTLFLTRDTKTMATNTRVNMMDLPIEMIDKILSYFSYDQLAKLRVVSHTFNNICSDKLNKGFTQLEQFHTKCLKAVKSRLPRRESERKHHPLARHSDILMAIETRLSMLSMTFLKYIEARHCCFIPGKVLDESFRVLRIVSQNTTLSPSNTQYITLPRPHDFLQEFRDISSMAMEHFDDKILPSIREKMKLENPRLYCFKNRSGRTATFVQPVKIPLSGDNVLVGCSPIMSSTKQLPKVDGENNKAVTFNAMNLYRVLHHTKAKYNITRRAVCSLRDNMSTISKKVQNQNISLKKKLNSLRRNFNFQKSLMKVMKSELEDTRNAMSIMSKDLNQLKNEQTSRVGTPSDQPTCSSLSTSMTSLLSLPVSEKLSSIETRGIKRKLDNFDERASKRCFCNSSYKIQDIKRKRDNFDENASKR